MRDLQRLGRILLHHGDGDALAVDLADGGEQLLPPRSATVRRKVRRAIAAPAAPSVPWPWPAPAAVRPTASARRDGASRPAWGSGRTPRRRRAAAWAGSMNPPISRFSRTESVGKTLASCGTKATPRRAISRGDSVCIGASRRRIVPRGRTQQAGDRLQQRGLAGAIGADDGDDFSLVHRERHALQDLVAAAIAGNEVARGQQGLRRLGCGRQGHRRRLILLCSWPDVARPPCVRERALSGRCKSIPGPTDQA